MILSKNNLVNLRDEIYQLTNLRELYLAENKLNLITLWLDNNNLTKLPKSIGNLVNLEEAQLRISRNPLKSLPVSIRKVEHALDSASKSVC